MCASEEYKNDWSQTICGRDYYSRHEPDGNGERTGCTAVSTHTFRFPGRSDFQRLHRQDNDKIFVKTGHYERALNLIINQC